jgi:hypothetical protein
MVNDEMGQEKLLRLLSDIGIQAITPDEPEEEEEDPFSVPKSTGPYFWLLVSRTSTAMGAGTDWEPYFYDYTASNRFESRNVTAGGEIRVPGMVGGNPRCLMAALCFHSAQPQTVKAWIGGSNFGRIQLKLNETRTEYTSSAWITLNVKQGVNKLLLMTNDVEFVFDALILREPHTRWVDPSRRGADRGQLVDGGDDRRILI